MHALRRDTIRRTALENSTPSLPTVPGCALLPRKELPAKMPTPDRSNTVSSIIVSPKPQPSTWYIVCSTSCAPRNMQRFHSVCCVTYLGLNASNNMYANHSTSTSLNQPCAPPAPYTIMRSNTGPRCPWSLAVPDCCCRGPPSCSSLAQNIFCLLFFSFNPNDPEG